MKEEQAEFWNLTIMESEAPPTSYCLEKVQGHSLLLKRMLVPFPNLICGNFAIDTIDISNIGSKTLFITKFPLQVQTQMNLVLKTVLQMIVSLQKIITNIL